MKILTAAMVLFAPAMVPTSTGAQEDCATKLAAIVPAGQSTNPNSYFEGRLLSAQHLKAGTREFRTRSGATVSLTKSLECRTGAAGAVTCWKCGTASDGSTHCWEITCPDVLTTTPVDPQANPQPPVPGIEGSPIGTAGAPSDRKGTGRLAAAADLLPVQGLRLATKLIPWGQTATISTDEASAKKNGRCEFRYRYETTNDGQAAAGPGSNHVLLNAATGPALAKDALPALAVATQHTASGLLQLKPGTWTLYVQVDALKQVAESDEQNNLRRVRVQVDGSCD